MESPGWQLFVTANYRSVYYLSGIPGAADTPALLLLGADGRCQAIGGRALRRSTLIARCRPPLTARPGVAARDVYRYVRQRLDASFWHHGGHGIGHHGHEAPRLIPGSDDVFEEADVFTIEPGTIIWCTPAASKICSTTRWPSFD